MGLAVPRRVQRGVLQAEVGREVDDPADPAVEVAEQLLALAVGQGQEHEVEPVDRHRVPGLEDLVAVGRGEVRVQRGHRLAGLRIAGRDGDVEIRMGRGDPQQLRTGVARRADDAYLGHRHTLYETMHVYARLNLG